MFASGAARPSPAVPTRGGAWIRAERRGRERRRSELKAGLVGCGSLSQRGILPHLSLPDAKERVQLAAVVDAVGERARQTAQRFDVPAHFTDVESMLAGADVDLVLVATPITAHFAPAMAAIQAG